MERGKQVCRILKDIRVKIAQENDIEFITSECTHKGDCAGTCPKCEAEVRYLESQLARRRASGRNLRIVQLLDCTVASIDDKEMVCYGPVFSKQWAPEAFLGKYVFTHVDENTVAEWDKLHTEEVE